jgi:hypothetical protein
MMKLHSGVGRVLALGLACMLCSSVMAADMRGGLNNTISGLGNQPGNIQAVPVDTSLSLNTVGDCFPLGSTLCVTVDVADLNGEMAVGGQFFLLYDNTVLDFEGMAPGDHASPDVDECDMPGLSPFDQEFIQVVDEVAGEILYVVGSPAGYTGSPDDNRMATIQFRVIAEGFGGGGVDALVRWDPTHDPGDPGNPPPLTRVSNFGGQAILPLQLIDLNGGDIICLDDTPPVITCPDDIEVECMDDIPAPNVASVQVDENCPLDVDVVWLGDSMTGGNFMTCPVVTRTYQATNACGLTSTCTQTITVNDIEPPEDCGCPDILVECPEDVPPPDVSTVCARDNCGILRVFWVSDVSDNMTCPETITRTFIAEDWCGNETVVEQLVIINDETDPVIVGCPQDIEVENDQDECGAIVNWQAPTVTDNCDDVDLTCNYYPGDFFPVGTTTVTCTAEDICGNQAECSFEVEVDDAQDPMFTGCPADINMSNDPGECGAVVTWTEPVASDNCPGFNVSQTHAPGDFFPVGCTTVTYTVTDASGNIATCEFEVCITDDEDPTVTGCPTTINANNDPGECGAVVVWQEPLFGDNCPGLVVTQNYYPGDFFGIGCTTVIYTATDAAGNEITCEFDICVSDTEDPEFTGCPNNIDVNNDAGECGAVVDWIEPVASDNCPGYTVDQSHYPGDFFPVGCTTVTYTVTDASGNFARCIFEVCVTDNEDPTITGCPTNINANNDPGECGAVVTWTEPVIEDNCPGVGFTQTHYPGDFFPVGCTTVTYTATDAYGNTATCMFDVCVEDTEDPMVAGCPDDIEVPADGGGCDAIVNWTEPNFTDNCPGLNVTQNYYPGDTFPVGCTTVIYTATDAAGNVATCEFEVCVVDMVYPEWQNCPADINVSNDLGECGAVVSWVEPTASDNCPGFVTDQTHFPGDYFDVGCTTVTYTVTDASGNEAICEFEVCVTDDEDPTVTGCPVSSIQVHSDAGDCGAVVDWVEPVFDDNCDVTVTQNYFPGDFFPVGCTTVTYTGTDPYGNSTECSFDVCVDDKNVLLADVELQGFFLGSCNRCITFDFYNCPAPDPIYSVDVDVEFTDGLALDVELLIPCEFTYNCITAVDSLHTLVETTPDFVIDGTIYTADFLNPDNSLVGGNLIDFPGECIIDILDFGLFTSQFGDPRPPYTCATAPAEDADINCDGIVDAFDFSFILINFFEQCEGCCTTGLITGMGTTSITVEELEAMGLGHLSAGDLNGDGVLDMADMEAFQNGLRP